MFDFYISEIIIYMIIAAGYVLKGMSLYAIGKRRGLPLYGMAWVPIGADWLLGSIADQYNRKTNKKKVYFNKILLFGSLLVVALIIAVSVTVIVALETVPDDVLLADMQKKDKAITLSAIVLLILLLLCAAAYRVFYYIVMYKTMRSCSPKNAAWMLVVSIVCAYLMTNIAEFICLICISKKDDGFIGKPKQEIAKETDQEEERMISYGYDPFDDGGETWRKY